MIHFCDTLLFQVIQSLRDSIKRGFAALKKEVPIQSSYRNFSMNFLETMHRKLLEQVRNGFCMLCPKCL